MDRFYMTYLHVLSGLPGSGAPQAIFRPRQKRQAKGGFFSICRLLVGSGLMRMVADAVDVRVFRELQVRPTGFTGLVV